MISSLSEIARLRGFRGAELRFLEEAAEMAGYDFDEQRPIDEAWITDVRGLGPAYKALVERNRDAVIASLRASGAQGMDVELAEDIAKSNIAMFDRLVLAALRMLTGTLEREIEAEVRSMRVKDVIQRAIGANS